MNFDRVESNRNLVSKGGHCKWKDLSRRTGSEDTDLNPISADLSALSYELTFILVYFL